MRNRVLRIFISSPSDVAEERQLACKVIERLNGAHSEQVTLEAVLWEQRVFAANLSFQEQIAAMRDMDLVVGILWKRVGSELPPERFKRDDGSVYESGTVFELETALACDEGPPVYVFKKTAPILYSRENVDEEKRQADLLEAWWRRVFYDAEHHFLRGFEPFATPAAFESRLTRVIEDWLDAEGLVSKGPVWDITQSSPFPGLRAYDADRAAVFFGRDLAIGEAVELLLQHLNREGSRPVLFVVGASGSGKSSLARAGIVPRLITPGIVPGNPVWHTAVVEPTGDVIAGLASRMYESLPILADSPQTTSEEWRELVLSEPKAAGQTVRWALKQVAKDDRSPKILLLIDQLETVIADPYHKSFAQAVRSLVDQAGVWLVATLRSDRYTDLQTLPDLLALKKVAVTYDLPAPGEAEIREVVRGPVRVAGLFLEEVKGRSLARELVGAAPTGDALPLLQMSLARLYAQRQGNTLTLQALDAMGGVPGAIAAHAEEIFARLSPNARYELQSLVRAMTRDVSRRPGGSLDFTVMISDGQAFATTPARQELVDAFVDAHLIVRDSKNHLRIAHEAVLRHWRRAADCLTAIADAELREARRRQIWLGLLSVTFLIVAAMAGLFAYWASSAKQEADAATVEARKERDRAEAVTVEAQKERDRAETLLQTASLNLARAHEERALGILKAPQLGSQGYQRALLQALEAQRQSTGGKSALRLDARNRLAQDGTGRAFAQRWTSSHITRDGQINAVAFSPDGRLLASASWDNTVRLWDSRTGRLQRTLEGHQGRVTAVAFSPRGDQLASSSDDRTVCLWDPATGKLRRKFIAHGDGVTAVAYAPEGRWLATGGGMWDRNVSLWNPNDGVLLRTLYGHEGRVTAVTFSPDGRLLASASADKTVRLWDPATGEALRTLVGDQLEVNSVAFSPDGQVLASASLLDKTVRLWNLTEGTLRATLQGHQGSVNSVAFSPDGRLLASASEDKTIRLWDPAEGRALSILEGHRDTVNSVAFSPDGRLLASASGGENGADHELDNSVRLWDAERAQSVRTLQGHASWAVVATVAFSPDGHLLAGASGSEVYPDSIVSVWDVATGELLRTLEGHEDEVLVSQLAFSPDGRVLASGSDDKTVRLWDSATGTPLFTLAGHGEPITSLVFSPDGRWLASGSRDKTVCLWDTATGELRHTLEGHKGSVTAVAFSRDGRLLASASYDKTVRLWDPTTGGALRTLNGHQDEVFWVSFSADGRLVASASWDNTLRLWDWSTGQLRQTLEGDFPFAVSSPDGRRLASAFHDTTVRVWDAATGELQRILEGPKEEVHEGLQETVNEGANEEVNVVAFSADGRLLADGSTKGVVRLWNPEAGELLQTLEGPQDHYVGCLGFSPDGRVLAVCAPPNEDLRLGSVKSDSVEPANTLRLWDLRLFQLLQNGPPPSARAALISETLQRIWGLRVDGLDIVPDSWDEPLPRDGDYGDQEITIEVTTAEATTSSTTSTVMRTFNIRPLLYPPNPDEDKLDQFLRWLNEQGI